MRLLEARMLISLKQKGWSNRKIADYVKVNRKTVDSYMARFKSLELTCEALLQLKDAELAELFTEDSQTEKEHYETLAGQLQPPCLLPSLYLTGNGAFLMSWNAF